MIPTTIAKTFAYAEENRFLNVINEGRTISLCTEPTYLDVYLDKTLPFRRHLESLHRKLTFRVGLMRQLAK